MSPLRPQRKIIEQAVYVVLVPTRPTREGGPNISIVTAKLRKRDADEVIAQIPGSWVEKVIASKP
jgi:hypothetical protein